MNKFNKKMSNLLEKITKCLKNGKTTENKTLVPQRLLSAKALTFTLMTILLGVVTAPAANATEEPYVSSIESGGDGVPVPLDMTPLIDKTQKELKLWYDKEAPKSGAEAGTDAIYAFGPNKGVKIKGEDYRDCHWSAYSDDGWELWSLPIGNGFMGVNVFGRTETERLQITEPSLFNPYPEGFANFSETYIDFGHTNVTNYYRDLSLNDAIAHVRYTYGGVNYTREMFASYPDKVFAIRLTASGNGNLTFTLRPTIPHIDAYSLATTKPGRGKSDCSVVAVADGAITLKGKMDYFGIEFEGQYKVIPVGGSMTVVDGDKIKVTDADEAVIYVAVGTNYELKPDVFTAGASQKLAGNAHPHTKLVADIAAAVIKGYDAIKTSHKADYKKYFERVNFDVGGAMPAETTDVLLSQYKKTNSDAHDKYLEELFFQYGRYLLIASSREGGLPANLQGIWNRYEQAPWSGGYWHNINIQMNYWASFATNLTDMYKPYEEYSKNYMADKAKGSADYYIGRVNPSAQSPAGQNGWTIGTGCWPYQIEGANYPTHSGPGVGAYVAQMFWDYYDFTRDATILSNYTYPALSGMSLFYTKAVVPFGDKLLIEHSFSPEQFVNGKEYETVGCAFDQQMIYDNYINTRRAAAALGITSNPILDAINSQIDKLDPVIVGFSGQIKEYREEKYYGEIGDPKHRHIAQLAGLYPGTVISSKTPAWLDAAKVTLTGREGGDESGWATAYEQQFWARTKDGNHAYNRYKHLIQGFVLPNLWGMHPPFQIDANFGGTVGVAEMLLQSQEGYIEPMAAIPDAWAKGRYSGLLARGNFEVSAEWSGGQAQTFEIKSNRGGECAVKYFNIEDATVSPSVTLTKSKDMIKFNTTAGTTYTISNIPTYTKVANPSSFSASSSADFKTVTLNWDATSDASSYNIYRAVESAPDYEFIKNVTTTSYNYMVPPKVVGKQATYRITAVGSNGRESFGVAKTVIPNVIEEFNVTFDKNSNDTDIKSCTILQAQEPARLRRSDSFLGIHFDFHARADDKDIGRNKTPEMINSIIDPVGPLQVTFRSEQKPLKITLQPSGKACDFTYTDKKVHLTISSLDIYDILVIEKNN